MCGNGSRCRTVCTEEDVIAVAGTEAVPDTLSFYAWIHSQDLFDLKVKEILCKPLRVSL